MPNASAEAFYGYDGDGRYLDTRACGFSDFRVGVKYLVFAQAKNPLAAPLDGHTVWLCGRTRDESNSDLDVEALGAPKRTFSAPGSGSQPGRTR